MKLRTLLSSSFLLTSVFSLIATSALAQVSVSGQVQIGPAPQPVPPPVYAPQPVPPPVYAPAPPPVYAPQPAPPPVYAPAPPPVYAPQPNYGYVQPYRPLRGQDGIYVRAGLGGGLLAGTNRVDNSRSPSDFNFSGGGVAIDLAVGGTVFPGFVLGLELMMQQAVRPNGQYLSTNVKFSTDTNNNFGLLGLFAEFYPRPHGGFHVGGLLGFTFFNRVIPESNQELAAAYGFGVGGNLGYVFRFNSHWGLDVSGRVNVGGVYGNGYDAASTERYTLVSASLLASILYH